MRGPERMDTTTRTHPRGANPVPAYRNSLARAPAARLYGMRVGRVLRSASAVLPESDE